MESTHLQIWAQSPRGHLRMFSSHSEASRIPQRREHGIYTLALLQANDQDWPTRDQAKFVGFSVSSAAARLPRGAGVCWAVVKSTVVGLDSLWSSFSSASYSSCDLGQVALLP